LTEKQFTVISKLSRRKNLWKKEGRSELFKYYITRKFVVYVGKLGSCESAVKERIKNVLDGKSLGKCQLGMRQKMNGTLSSSCPMADILSAGLNARVVYSRSIGSLLSVVQQQHCRVQAFTPDQFQTRQPCRAARGDFPSL
jgi:hypothetical protein